MKRDQRQAFEEIYGECFDPISRFVSRRVNSALRDDVVAEVFLITWKRWADFPEPTLPWLYGVARNVIANVQRREHKRSGQLLLDEVSSPDSTESIADNDHLSHCLAKLRESDRFILTLVAWEELDPVEAAEVLGCSVSAFYVRLHRARERFEKLLNSEIDIGASGGRSSLGNQGSRRRTR